LYYELHVYIQLISIYTLIDTEWSKFTKIWFPFYHSSKAQGLLFYTTVRFIFDLNLKPTQRNASMVNGFLGKYAYNSRYNYESMIDSNARNEKLWNIYSLKRTSKDTACFSILPFVHFRAIMCLQVSRF
jgi:hypothetical protein